MYLLYTDYVNFYSPRMEMNLNFVDMPDSFCRLLKVDMTSSSGHHKGLQNYILRDSALKGIVSRILTEGGNFDIHSHLKSLGWFGIRDRMLSF